MGKDKYWQQQPAELLRSCAGNDGHHGMAVVPIVIPAHFPNFQAGWYK